MDNKLPKKYMLTKTNEYSFVFKRGLFKIIANSIHLQYANNNYNYPRFGLIVRKKIVKKSHERNYLKRKLREYFRIKKYLLPSWDMIFLVKKSFNKEQFDLIEKKLDDFFNSYIN